jgi:hypothetical protein
LIGSQPQQPTAASAKSAATFSSSLGATLIDCPIVLSLNAGLDGRIGLHAARAGGQRLLDFYRKLKLRLLRNR